MIRIYPGQMPSLPIEEHPWDGTIAAWFEAAGVDFAAQEVQPVTLTVNEVAIPSTEWSVTYVKNTDAVDIRPIPRGSVFKALGSILNKVFGFIFGAPKVAKRYNTPSGKGLETADATANTAKLNSVVPELVGRLRRYPDYLTQPRRYFSDPRTQYLEMLLCIGPGEYAVEQVNVGNTAFADLQGAEYTIHSPGADLSGVSQHLNWYSCPEVGGTSGGTAGLELTSIPSSAVGPTAGAYELSGDTVTIPAADSSVFPASWGGGTTMSLMFSRDVVVTRTSETVGELVVYTNHFEAAWSDITPTVGLMLATDGAAGLPESVRIMSVSGSLVTLGQYIGDGTSGAWETLSTIAPGNYRIGVERAGRVFTVSQVTTKQVKFADANFVARTVSAAESAWNVNPDTVYGEMAGPFAVCPVSEKTSAIEFDIFFPNGLSYIRDNGQVIERGVGAELSWSEEGSGVWTSVSKWYSAATLDPIGFTERFDALPNKRYLARLRRRGATSTSTQANDKMQWLGLRSLLNSPTSYEGWTVMSARFKGLGQIAASSENQVNIVGTRKLPTLLPDGTWSELVPTRSISAAFRHIAQTAGYADASLNIGELQRLHGIWTDRGETADYVFDETTAKAAMDVVLAAGMAELTRDEAQLRPVREDLRTFLDHPLFSMQNTLGKGIRKSFSAPSPDDNDGYVVEYTDESDSWSKKTVVSALPDSPQLKLKTLKLDAVTDRTRAWRIGMREARKLRYRRWQYTLTTELEGRPVGYGDFIGLADESPGFAQSMLLKHIEGDSNRALLVVSEPLDWSGISEHFIRIRRPDGTAAGPFTVTPGDDDYTLYAEGIPQSDWPALSLKQELPHVVFGAVLPAVLTNGAPDGALNTKLTAVNYDTRIFADDDNYPEPA